MSPEIRAANAMTYRPLGRTGIHVSAIGFGTWGIGGATPGATSYGPTDDRESLRALRYALELGMTFYDTSNIYGMGHSERLIGQAFRHARSRVVIASKAGFLAHDGPQDFSPSHLCAALERSLEHLQTEYLDLFQLHNPSADVLAREEVLTTLQALKRQGAIRAVGVSLRSPADIPVVIASGMYETIQVNFNLADQRLLEQGLLARCQAAGIGVIVRTPLCFGFLTGEYHPASVFGEQDHRSRWSDAQRAMWAEAPRLFEETLTTLVGSPAQRALRFCLSYPAISTVIPGMLTPQQVDENAAASRLGPLSERERRQIEQVYCTHTFFIQRPPSAAGTMATAARS